MLLEEAAYYKLDSLIEMMDLHPIRVFVSGFQSDKKIDTQATMYAFPRGSKIRHLKDKLEKERLRNLSIDKILDTDNTTEVALNQILTDNQQWNVGHQSTKDKYTWKLKKFNKNTTSRLTSPHFTIANTTWYLLLLPDYNEHLALFLSAEGLAPGVVIPVTFELYIINQKDAKKSHHMEASHNFKADEFDYGFKTFFKRDGLNNPDFMVEGTIILEVVVHVHEKLILQRTSTS